LFLKQISYGVAKLIVKNRVLSAIYSTYAFILASAEADTAGRQPKSPSLGKIRK
jgi:hypothetical protein